MEVTAPGVVAGLWVRLFPEERSPVLDLLDVPELSWPAFRRSLRALGLVSEDETAPGVVAGLEVLLFPEVREEDWRSLPLRSLRSMASLEDLLDLRLAGSSLEACAPGVAAEALSRSLRARSFSRRSRSLDSRRLLEEIVPLLRPSRALRLASLSFSSRVVMFLGLGPQYLVVL